ncbi:putative alanine racemase-domain-containing protein [Hygrophoropsis aurantiaca]|uniref:Alanine racemase-domain-containing protein n=1 Tax=Hygrophoropsis aurantiaca TaxID=72124 RepID=A0ACB8A1D6_9AGAM|nr:putative alanine racemase-domain-containing protein [Hygrophoropsis aurantiaca]
MVSALLVDALNNPTKALQDLFATYVDDIDKFPSAVAAHFSSVFLKTDDIFREIPPLDVSHPPAIHPNRALIRFRAMIQDNSPSPEMYLQVLEGNKCGGWGISQELSDDSWSCGFDYSMLKECHTMWAVTVPGEASWFIEGSERSCMVDPTHHPPQPHKFPIPDIPHIGVQIKIYDGDLARSLKLTDIATFVGILTSEPIGVESNDLPTVPTLHVLFHRMDSLESVEPLIHGHNAGIRESLMEWIASEALGGDRDAAEWVLLSAIAKVHSRVIPLLPPSLTLSRFPQPKEASAIPTLSYVLSEILPLFITVPLSLGTLNKVNFTPESIEEDLHSGVLQVSQGTTILLTENGIQEGQLVEKGIMNIHAIQELINSQTLEYKFPYSKFSFPSAISFIICSEGGRSAFFQTHTNTPWQGDSSVDLYKSKTEVVTPSSEKLTAFRSFIFAAKASVGSILVSEETSEYIQNDFVRLRQGDQTITADDLIHLMKVSRLLAASMGASEVTAEVWERTKALDIRRKGRF